MADKNRYKKSEGARPGRGRRIEKPQNVGRTLTRILSYLLHYKARLIIAAVCMVLAAVCTVAGTYFLKPALNNFIVPLIGQQNPDLSGFIRTLCIMAAFYITGAIANFTLQRMMIEIPRPVAEEYDEARSSYVEISLTKEQEEKLSLLKKDVHEWAPLELLPAKTTVSEMKRMLSEEPEEDEDENVDFHAVNMRVKESDQKWKDRGYTASQMGTLVHSAWQYIDFTGMIRRNETPDWKNVLELLCGHGMISKDQAELLLPFAGNMQTFYESGIAKKMAEAETRSENGPYREIPFALAWPSENEEFSLVQGMIDCWFVDTDGQAVLVDYKTDRLSGSLEEKEAELKRRYQVQLDMYAKAITAATGKTVKEKIIWLIRDGVAVNL